MATITRNLTDGGAPPPHPLTHGGTPDAAHQSVGTPAAHAGLASSAAHATPKRAAAPAVGGHQGKLPSTGGHVLSRTGGQPAKPSRAATPKAKPAATKAAHTPVVVKPRKAPTPAPVHSRPTKPGNRPTPKPPTKHVGSTGVGTPATSTSSPYPGGAAFGTSGLDLFPIILLAAGGLALWYLWTHRKRGK